MVLLAWLEEMRTVQIDHIHCYTFNFMYQAGQVLFIFF